MDAKKLEEIRKRDKLHWGHSLQEMAVGALVHAVADRHELLAELDRQTANAVRPRAWIRGVTHMTPGEPMEYDEECCAGDEPPDDNPDWQPLWTRPGGTLGLLAACVDSMKISMRDNGGRSDWTHMINAIEAHFRDLRATPPHTTAEPTRTDEG